MDHSIEAPSDHDRRDAIKSRRGQANRDLEAALEERLTFEPLVSRLSATFINLATEDDAECRGPFAGLAPFCREGRSYLSSQITGSDV